MKKNYEIGTLGLWLISIIASLVILRDTGLFTYLAPVYFVCMLGSVKLVRRAQMN